MSATQYKLKPFWIRIKYGATKLEEILTFDPRGFTTAHDVLERIRLKYKNSEIFIFNEHDIKLDFNNVIQKARTYTIKRKPIV